MSMIVSFQKGGTRRWRASDRADSYLRADFPVLPFDGTKSILLSTRTIMGGRNPFLGIAYVVVGGLCILLGALFTATHLIKPRLVNFPHAHPDKQLSENPTVRKYKDKTSSLTGGKTMTGNSVTTATSAGIQTSPARQLQPDAVGDPAKELDLHPHPRRIQTIIVFPLEQALVVFQTQESGQRMGSRSLGVPSHVCTSRHALPNFFFKASPTPRLYHEPILTLIALSLLSQPHLLDFPHPSISFAISSLSPTLPSWT